jgi:hypothetical protein
MKLKLLVPGFFLLAKLAFSQEISRFDHIGQKAVIGFPGITTNQLSQIKLRFANYTQIVSAVYFFDSNNCLLISFDPSGKKFTVYDELLKTISDIYDVTLCYIKPASVYDEVSSKYKSGSGFIVK